MSGILSIVILPVNTQLVKCSNNQAQKHINLCTILSFFLIYFQHSATNLKVYSLKNSSSIPHIYYLRSNAVHLCTLNYFHAAVTLHTVVILYDIIFIHNHNSNLINKQTSTDSSIKQDIWQNKNKLFMNIDRFIILLVIYLEGVHSVVAV